MGKKKSKKPQKSGGATAAQASDDKKKVEDPFEEEEIQRDDDLFISDSDVDTIANYIRTTNKSFQSLGNTLVECFTGRCAVSVSQALFSLFDESTKEDRDDTIRRLNIIYMMFRLPEIEVELRVKPTKTMNDIYNHIYASFFFYVEESSLEYESVLARVIVCNKVSTIEKLNAPDFIKKAHTITNLVADHNAYKKWESENNAHWPKNLDDDVPVTTVMKNLGWDRKEYEAAMNEAFYPLYHPVPTLLPPWLDIQHEEVLLMDENDLEHLSKNEARWKTLAADEAFGDKCDANRGKLLKALKVYKKDVDKFQDKILENYTPEEITLITREVMIDDTIEPSSSESGGSCNEIEDDDDSPFLTAVFTDPDDNTKKYLKLFDAAVGKAADAIIDGFPLNATNSKMLIDFIQTPKINNTEHFLKLYSATKHDLKLKGMIRQNSKVVVALLNKILINEELPTLERYLRVFTDSNIIIQALETALKIFQDLKVKKQLNDRVRKSINTYVRAVMSDEEVRRNRRNLRLVAIVLTKMLNEGIILVEDNYQDMSEFALNFTEVREVTTLYSVMTQMRIAREKRAAEIAKVVAEQRAVLQEAEQPGPSPKAEEPGPSASS